MFNLQKPFTGFPLPKNHVLVCPHCTRYKMHEFTLMKIEGFKCAAPDDICGKFTSKLEVELLYNQMMVEE